MIAGVCFGAWVGVAIAGGERLLWGSKAEIQIYGLTAVFRLETGERLLMPIRLAKQGRRGFQDPRRTVLGVVFGEKMLRVPA